MMQKEVAVTVHAKSQKALTEYDLKRYNRQMMIKGFGEDGQRKLKNTKVFVAGVGGLGSPVATYLAVAGFGHITIADLDVVDLSNLNRQILHWDKDVGAVKVKSGYEKLMQINTQIEIEAFQGRIDENNIFELTKGHDLIIDAMDNFPTRYLLNQASLKHKIPFVHASVWGLEGRITTIVPERHRVSSAYSRMRLLGGFPDSRSDARCARNIAGDRGGQGHTGHRQDAGEPASDLRWRIHGVPRDRDQEEPGM